MSNLGKRFDELKAAVTEFDGVKTDLNATVQEFQKRTVGVQRAPKPKSGEKRSRKKGANGEKFPSLKEAVLQVLEKNPDGLALGGIVTEIQGMIDRKEYASGAKSLSAVVSQAVNALKVEELINHDKDSKKYTKKQAAA